MFLHVDTTAHFDLQNVTVYAVLTHPVPVIHKSAFIETAGRIELVLGVESSRDMISYISCCKDIREIRQITVVSSGFPSETLSPTLYFENFARVYRVGQKNETTLVRPTAR